MKTVPDKARSVDRFVADLPNPRRREDAKTLLALFAEVTGETPVLWGDSIVGYGQYHYQYASGRDGDFMRGGFSPRKQNMVIYVIPGFSKYETLLAKLGKHKTGSSCLYVNKLADVDPKVLRVLLERSWKEMGRKYPVS